MENILLLLLQPQHRLEKMWDLLMIWGAQGSPETPEEAHLTDQSN